MRNLSNFYFNVLFDTQVHLCMAFKLKTKCRAQEAEGLYFTSQHLYQINLESTESFFLLLIVFSRGRRTLGTRTESKSWGEKQKRKTNPKWSQLCFFRVQQ